MEKHPSKRRRVEERSDRPSIHHGLHRIGERASHLGDRKEEPLVPKIVLPLQENTHHDDPARPGPQSRNAERSRPSQSENRLRARQPNPTMPNSNLQSTAQPASTVLAVAINNGQGVVSTIDVPMASRSESIPGYGMLTMPNGANQPSSTGQPGNNPSSVNNNPAAVTPPPAEAAAQARNQALSTQEAMAKQLNVAPQAPSNTAPNAIPAPSQSLMAINAPDSHSQEVLSMPSTPIPSTPQSSLAPSASSYFSSSPTSIFQSTLPETSASTTSIASPVITSNTLIPNISQIPSTSNSTSPGENFHREFRTEHMLMPNVASTPSTTSTPSTSTPISLNSATSVLSATGLTSASQSVTSEASSFSIQSSAASSSGAASLTSASASQSLTGFETSTRGSQTITSASSSGSFNSFSTLSTSANLPSQTSGSSSSLPFTSGSATTTGAGAGGIAGAGNTSSASSPASSATGGSGGSGAPPTPVLVGGIVGGVAGLTMILALLLLFLRWRRGKQSQRRNISPPIPQHLGPGGVPQAVEESGNMTQRSSTTPIAAAGFFGRLRPASSQTTTTADTAPSERGFQKISGRKLPSVLASGGDGYGNSAIATGPSTGPPGPSSSRGVTPGIGPSASLAPALRPSSPHSLSGSSFYRDSHGFYGGVVPENAEADSSSSPSTSPSHATPLAVSGRSPQGRGGPSPRPPEVANIRPGPARTPVINQPGTVPMRTPSRANQPPPRPERGTTPPPPTPFRDGLGRSHPSQDGSRGSRFREDTTPP